MTHLQPSLYQLVDSGVGAPLGKDSYCLSGGLQYVGALPLEIKSEETDLKSSYGDIGFEIRSEANTKEQDSVALNSEPFSASKEAYGDLSAHEEPETGNDPYNSISIEVREGKLFVNGVTAEASPQASNDLGTSEPYFYAQKSDFDGYNAYLGKSNPYDLDAASSPLKNENSTDSEDDDADSTFTIIDPSKIPASMEPPKEFFHNFYWNEQFQILLERPTTTFEEQKQRVKEIKRLNQRFVSAAQPVVSKIVEEYLLPPDKKTILPVDVGGVAGGSKYLHERLFLKFAKDDETFHLYGGDEWAQKAAGHELKSLNALVSCDVPHLHFPLMALVNYLGYRVVVISKLPISKDTLRYGSADAGFIIHDDDPELTRLMRAASLQLNLRAHRVLERKTSTIKILYGPVDIEGHIGSDGRCYVVDTARLFPPGTPDPRVRGSHLFRLLRPEFVKKNPLPLSSDAFTVWGKEDREVNNLHVVEATNRLLEQVVPQFARSDDLQEWIQSSSQSRTKTKETKNRSEKTRLSIKDLVHTWGINVRFLPMILHHLPDTQTGLTGKKMLWTEMGSRVCRALLFQEMRDLPVEKRNASGYREKVADFLNRVFAPFVKFSNSSDECVNSCGQTSHLFWETQIRDGLQRRFILVWGNPLKKLNPNGQRIQVALPTLPDLLQLILPARLLLLLSSLCGIRLKNEETLQKLVATETVSHNPPLFTPTDIEAIGFTCKLMTTLPAFDVSKGNFEDAEKFYRNELLIKEKQLGKLHPQVALTLANLAELYARIGQPKKAGRVFSRAAFILKKVFRPDHIEVAALMERVAISFYLKYDQWEKAETTLEQAIKIRKTALSREKNDAIRQSIDREEAVAAMEALACVQMRRQKYAEAQKIYDEVVEIRRSQRQAKNASHTKWESKGEVDLSRAENALCLVLLLLGETSSAEKIAQGVLDRMHGKLASHSEYGVACERMGMVERARGSFAKSQEWFKRALAVETSALGEKHSFVGGVLAELGELTAEMGDRSEALEYYRRAKRVLEDALGQEHSEVERVEQAIAQLEAAGSATVTNSAGPQATLMDDLNAAEIEFDCVVPAATGSVLMSGERQGTSTTVLGGSIPTPKNQQATPTPTARVVGFRPSSLVTGVSRGKTGEGGIGGQGRGGRGGRRSGSLLHAHGALAQQHSFGESSLRTSSLPAAAPLTVSTPTSTSATSTFEIGASVGQSQPQQAPILSQITSTALSSGPLSMNFPSPQIDDAPAGSRTGSPRRRATGDSPSIPPVGEGNSNPLPPEPQQTRDTAFRRALSFLSRLYPFGFSASVNRTSSQLPEGEPHKVVIAHEGTTNERQELTGKDDKQVSEKEKEDIMCRRAMDRRKKKEQAEEMKEERKRTEGEEKARKEAEEKARQEAREMAKEEQKAREREETKRQEAERANDECKDGASGDGLPSSSDEEEAKEGEREGGGEEEQAEEAREEEEREEEEDRRGVAVKRESKESRRAEGLALDDWRIDSLQPLDSLEDSGDGWQLDSKEEDEDGTYDYFVDYL